LLPGKQLLVYRLGYFSRNIKIVSGHVILFKPMRS
jgi:hypothetical protein